MLCRSHFFHVFGCCLFLGLYSTQIEIEECLRICSLGGRKRERYISCKSPRHTVLLTHRILPALYGNRVTKELIFLMLYTASSKRFTWWENNWMQLFLMITLSKLWHILFGRFGVFDDELFTVKPFLHLLKSRFLHVFTIISAAHKKLCWMKLAAVCKHSCFHPRTVRFYF